MGKGSTTTSNSTTSSADPQAASLYRDILTRAQGVAATPYQSYSGELTAPVNAQQTAGIAGINANANYANPYIARAAELAGSSVTPIGGDDIARYYDPYQQKVIDATTSQFQHDNAQQMTQLQGNQIAQGALGGNATGVAKGILAGQQGRTQASTIAGLESAGYDKALAAAQRQQQTGLAGANAYANYGISGQNAALAGAGAQINAGTLQQQTQQAQDTSNYGQFTQQQAYPYQQLQWLAGLGTGVGSNLGGTSNGSTTTPQPNQTAQWLGLGLSAASMLSDRNAKEAIEKIGTTNDGQNIYRYRYKGQPGYHIGLIAQEVKEDHPESVQRHGGLHYVDLKGATDDAVSRAAGGGVGGVPWEGAQGWIPTMQIHGGAGAPHGSAPSAPRDQGLSSADAGKLASGLAGAGKSLQGLDWSGAYNAGLGNLSGDAWGGGSFWKGDAYGGSSASPTPGIDASEYGEGFAAGGGVGGAALGYAPSDDAVDPDVMDWLGHKPMGLPRMVEAAPNIPDAGGQRFPDMSFEDRAAPTVGAIARGNFDEQGAGQTTFEGTPGMQAANAGLVPSPRPRPDGAAGPVGAPDDEEDDAPATGLASAARGAGAPVMAFGPEGAPGGYRGLPDAIRRPSGEEPGFGLGLLSRNAQTGLLAAGLGMLSSRSPNLGNAVGDGARAGLETYGAANEADRKALVEADKLSREAQKLQFDQGMAGRKQTETERHNKASEKDTAANRAPSGMRFNKAGELEDIPGWIPTLEKAAKARKGPEGDAMTEDGIQMLADRVRAGDAKALVGLGRGAQGRQDLVKVQERVAADAKEGKPTNEAARNILQNAAQQVGLVTAERTQAQIMAKLSVYGRTAFKATAIAEALSDEVDRTQWQPVNKIINAAKTKTGDPKIVALGQALQTLSNEYARAIGGGHGTVHMQEQAERRLSEVQTKEQLKAVIAVMKREILAEEGAMPEARQHIRDIYNPKPGGGVHSIAGENGMPAPSGPVPGASGVPPAAQRKIDEVYDTPQGKLKWNGNGWVRP